MVWAKNISERLGIKIERSVIVCYNPVMKEAYYAKYIVKRGDIFYSTNTEPIMMNADPATTTADNLKEVEELAKGVCFRHILENPNDKIEYIIFRHTIEEVVRVTYSPP